MLAQLSAFLWTGRGKCNAQAQHNGNILEMSVLTQHKFPWFRRCQRRLKKSYKFSSSTRWLTSLRPCRALRSLHTEFWTFQSCSRGSVCQVPKSFIKSQPQVPRNNRLVLGVLQWASCRVSGPPGPGPRRGSWGRRGPMSRSARRRSGLWAYNLWRSGTRSRCPHSFEGRSSTDLVRIDGFLTGPSK